MNENVVTATSSSECCRSALYTPAIIAIASASANADAISSSVAGTRSMINFPTGSPDE